MVILNLQQSRQVLVRESKFVRKAVIKYIDSLEEQLKTIQMPRNYIEALESLLASEKEKQKLISNNQELIQKVEEMTPKVSYYDMILKSSSSKIASDYGMNALKMNSLLKELVVQYKQNNQWFLKTKYLENGYTKMKTHTFTHSNGNLETREYMCWTQKGRLFLYDFLKQHGHLPEIEKC